MTQKPHTITIEKIVPGGFGIGRLEDGMIVFVRHVLPGEKVCIRPAIIEFALCESLTTPAGESGPIAETVESLGHGGITGLQRHEDGRYEIIGEFGTVYVVAERPLLRLKGP